MWNLVGIVDGTYIPELCAKDLPAPKPWNHWILKASAGPVVYLSDTLPRPWNNWEKASYMRLRTQVPGNVDNC